VRRQAWLPDWLDLKHIDVNWRGSTSPDPSGIRRPLASLQLPKRLQPGAKEKLHNIWTADTREAANQAFDLFLETYGAKYPKVCECLVKDRDVLLTFYDFPAEHWIHLRTTNPIESVFATVRLRHRRTKGGGSRIACLAMVHQLMQSASERWRLLNGATLLTDVIAGVQFTDGVKSQEIAA
jgi:putative transposase